MDQERHSGPTQAVPPQRDTPHARSPAPLRVVLPDGERLIPFQPGQSLRQILELNDCRVRSACGGNGACGRCRVRVTAGILTPPTGVERERLSPRLLDQGVRLACQARPLSGVEIHIDHPAPPTHWHPLPPHQDTPGRLPLPPPPPHCRANRPLGVAVDLGTTRIRLSLWDLTRGQRLDNRTGLNPQAPYGADVLTRLEAAHSRPRQAHQLAKLVHRALAAALHDLARRDTPPGTDLLGQVGRVVILGNTAMLLLLAEESPHTLLQPEQWQRAIPCIPRDTGAWCKQWGIPPDTRVELAPPLAGFVGSDLLAGVLASGLTDAPPGSLFIDFGTNTELALWDGHTLLVSSTPGGPAFEGSGISCGMPAERGAIAGVTWPDTPGGPLTCQVIGGGAALGVCGSGLVDLVAGLRRAGIMRSSGRFPREWQGAGFPLGPDCPDLTLTPRDVDLFQRAKGAVGATLLCLLEQAGLTLQQLRRVCVSGAFGRYLQVDNAQAVGLLPPLPGGAVELFGNSALAGGERLLFADDVADTLARLGARARLVNMGQVPEFEERFVEQLWLQPMQPG